MRTMGKVFCAEFRDMIVELHLVHGKSIKWLADEYAVSASTIGRWVTCYRNKRMLDAEKLSKGVPFDNSPHNKKCINSSINKVL